MKNYMIKLLFLFFIVSLFHLLLLDPIVFGAGKKGAVMGTVQFPGTVPKSKSIPIKIDPNICGSAFLEEPYVNPENKGVQNAVISLKNKSDKVTSNHAEDRVYIINKNCKIEPNITVMQVNKEIVIKNADPILHVLQFTHNDQTLFNLPLSGNGNIVKQIDQLGPIHVKCLIHPFMEAFFLVIDSPIYTQTDRNGSFKLPDINSGKYILSVWHPTLKSIEKEIEISQDQPLEISINLD